ncbi:conjugal transfer protein TrbE [Synergistales bacterium]|nr:conjugal transfer protein TrbE [Synergistales bacterium]
MSNQNDLHLLKEKNDVGFSDLLYYSTIVDSGVMLLKNGALLSGFWYMGSDQESATIAELEYLCVMTNRALKIFDKGWMVHVESVRKPIAGYPTGNFTEPVNMLIDEERRDFYEKEGAHFETKHAVFVTYFPPLTERSFLGKAFMWLLGENVSGERALLEKSIREFKQRVSDFVDIFTSAPQIKVQIMSYNSETNTCGLTQALEYIINGRWHRAELPEVPMFMDTILARDLLVGSPLVYDNKYVSIVAVMEYPHESWAGMMHELTLLPFEVRFSNRFIFTDYKESRGNLNSLRKRWMQRTSSFLNQMLNNPNGPVNQDAVRMIGDIDDAVESVDSGMVAFGHHTSVVLVRSDCRESLGEKVRMVVKILERKGYIARIENYNAMEALLGSFPGAGRENVRKPLVSSMNLANIIPLTTDWAGEEYCPCPQYPPHSAPLLHAASVSSTPFRFNLHDGDVGHTLILGPTGSGKSTILSLIISQFERYENSQIFVFDKGYSMLPLTLACRSGSHYELGAENGLLSLCPLASIDSEADKVAASEWVETVLSLSKIELNPKQRGLLTAAIRNLAETTAIDPETKKMLPQSQRAAMRSLTHFASSVQDRDIQDVLEYYTGDKDAGVMFDGVRNNIEYKKLTVFEMDHIASMSQKIFIPAFLFLFREVEKRISDLRGNNAPPSLIVIDEAWLALKNPMFREKIREWLLTLRKKNCAVILATQDVGEIIKSPIRDTILDSCRTKILLPNQNARSQGMIEFYTEYLGLNEKQIEIIAEAIPKRQYYFTNTHSRNFRLFDLGLGPVAVSFVGASAKEDLMNIRKLYQDHGDRWPEFWLKKRNLEKAAARFSELYNVSQSKIGEENLIA